MLLALIIGWLNDLWRYRVNDSTWTWISGSYAVNQLGVYGTLGNVSTENVPGGRCCAVGWFDSSKQEFWLFGGSGFNNNANGTHHFRTDICVYIIFVYSTLFYDFYLIFYFLIFVFYFDFILVH